MMKSRAVVIYADKDPIEGLVEPGPHQMYRNPRVCVEERHLDDLHPDKIRVEMVYGGLCGTDVHLMEVNPETGYIRSSAPAEIPVNGRVIGHEGIGTVLEIGSQVKNVRPGDYVTFESIVVCHYCDLCRKGEFNQCRRARLLGLEEDGLFGTVVDVPAMLAHDVTDLIRDAEDLKAMACVEPAGVAYVACQNTGITDGDTVVIFGAGPIGLLTAMLSKTVFGASMIYIIEPVAFRRNFAGKWFDHVYDVGDFFQNTPPSVHVVIEASGNLDNLNRIFRGVDAGGRIALLARSGAPLVLDHIDHMITNSISCIGSRGHLGGAFDHILNLYKNGRIPLNEIVTSVVDGPEALLDFLISPEKVLEENCKVLVNLG